MSRPLKGDQPLDQRLQLLLTAADVTAVDDWRSARRVPTRSEAIRQLIARGLTVPDEQPEASAPKAKRGRKGTP